MLSVAVMGWVRAGTSIVAVALDKMRKKVVGYKEKMQDGVDGAHLPSMQCAFTAYMRVALTVMAVDRQPVDLARDCEACADPGDVRLLRRSMPGANSSAIFKLVIA